MSVRSEQDLRARLSALPVMDDRQHADRTAPLPADCPGLPQGEALVDLTAGLLDLTSLEATDTPGSTVALCRRAKHPGAGLPPVAAVCVFPDLAPVAVSELSGSGVRVASVAGAFPSGRAFRPVRMADVRSVLDAGADEVDLVMDRAAFSSGDVWSVFTDVAEVKRMCEGRLLKVILETGGLDGPAQVREAAWVALLAGADMLKTSTGKIAAGATVPDVLLLAEAVREFEVEFGLRRGVKVSGGVRSAEDAFRYVAAVTSVLGPAALDPARLRVGASALLGELVTLRRALGS